MKTVNEIQKVVEQRLRKLWHLDVAGEETIWPHDISLGKVSSAALTVQFASFQRQVYDLRQWATARGAIIRESSRRVHGTSQPVPTHVTIPDIDTAAAICGKPWITKIDRGRHRAAILRTGHADCERIANVLRSVGDYTDLDFDLLLTVTDWFKTNIADGLTPRQVPIPGVHAKWLNSHGPVIEMIIGTPLGLMPRHPARIHFTYLDPDHLHSGGRRFDSATVGDTMRPAYEPEVVIITENKDTAIHFPSISGGIAIEGEGYGGSTIAAFDWITEAPTLVYWGDLDTAGFEILDGYRRDGVAVVSILMSIDTYRSYARWGTFHYPNGQPIGTTEPKALLNLTETERAAYHAVCNPVGELPPRVEQERIPLRIAHNELNAIRQRWTASM